MKKPIKLAIAEDHLMVRQGWLAFLKDFPDLNVVIEVANGEELLEQFKKKQAQVVLLDLDMPKMDGFETTELLHKKYPETKIIIVTSHNEESFINHLIRKGAHGFILKEQDFEKVVDAIYGVLENGYFFNDRISKAMVKGLMETDSIRPTFNKVNLSERETEIIKLMSKEYTTKCMSSK
ncbi:MAG TPA: response regulator transcription factor [Bacteroidia bacterium]|jgi:DNA-binding NarL/FixJ family response regulator|nr:response regulator transcription factor [Bacteroidia bacterium]